MNANQRRERIFGRIREVLIILVLILTVCVPSVTYAAEKAEAKPAKPTIGAKVTSAGNAVKITISKTAGAEGYRIYMKAPGAESYKKIKSVTKDGTAKRTYTKKSLTEGKYYFKVRAYRVVDGKKIFGSYSKAVSVKIYNAAESLADLIVNTPETIEFVNPMGYFGDASITGQAKGQPCFYDFRAKKDAELPGGLVYRLLSVNSDGTELVESKGGPGVVDEKAISISPYAKGKMNVIIFAYESESDADAHKNPVARSQILDITIGDDDEGKIYADITFKNGYAYFGTYPQVKVTDTALLNELSKHSGEAGQECFEFKGKKYMCTENGWFEERPVEWVILEGSSKSDSVTLMCNTILLECGYSDWAGYEAGGRWKDSFVRYRLNGYNGSFKNIWSLDIFGGLFGGDIGRVLMEQTYDGCEDKVLLPSKAQLSKMTAQQRVRKASDMVKKADKQGYWCIDSDGKGNITLVKPDGTFTTHAAYRQDGEGYVPVIKVDLKHCNIISE